MRLTLLTMFSAILFFSGFFAGMLVTQQAAEHVTGMTEIELAGESSASIPIFAVSAEGIGVKGKGTVEIMPGKGRLLFNANPFVEPDTQYSLEIARNVAERLTGKSLGNADSVYSIEAGHARLIGGPSAGAAMCIATIAAIQGKQPRQDTTITGTIMPNGYIGQVSGILEKAETAAQNGIKTFMVPQGQGSIIVYEKIVEESSRPGQVFRRVYYEPITVNLNQVMQAEHGMQVIEISNIQEAVEIAFAE